MSGDADVGVAPNFLLGFSRERDWRPTFIAPTARQYPEHSNISQGVSSLAGQTRHVAVPNLRKSSRRPWPIKRSPSENNMVASHERRATLGANKEIRDRGATAAERNGRKYKFT